MKKSTKRAGNRFETSLLWKNNDVVMPKSKTIALNRLFCQKRKMDKDADFVNAYNINKLTDLDWSVSIQGKSSFCQLNRIERPQI